MSSHPQKGTEERVEVLSVASQVWQGTTVTGPAGSDFISSYDLSRAHCRSRSRVRVTTAPASE